MRNIIKKFVMLLRKPSGEFAIDLIAGINQLLLREEEPTAQKAKELQLYYDEVLREDLGKVIAFDKNEENEDFQSSLERSFPRGRKEALFMLLQYLIGENKRKAFLKLMDIIEEDNIFFKDSLFCFARFYYWYYRGSFWHLKDADDGESLDYGNYAQNVEYNSAIKAKVLYCAMTEENDKENRLQYYKQAIKEIETAIQSKSEASYLYIKAKLLFFAYKNTLDERIKLDDIRFLLKDAIEKESTTNMGLRRRSEYLVMLSDINNYETALLSSENELKIKQIEASSVKKFSAFSAFVSFAVGTLSKFLSGTPISFNETVGYLLILFGISVAIFSILDLIVLGPFSAYFDKKHLAEKSAKRQFVVRAIGEIALSIVAVILGLLIGKGYILK